MTGPQFSSLKLEQWPERDRELWIDCQAPADLLDEGGRAAAWRPATIQNIGYHYGTFLWWLRRRDGLDPAAAPLDRASVSNVRDFVADYGVGHAKSSTAAIVGAIADVVRATSPGSNTRWIYTIARRLKRQARPLKPDALRKRPVIDLIELGDMLKQRGLARLDEDPRAGAIDYRDGLMVVLETSLPLRRRNFCGLRLGHTLISESLAYRIQIPGPQMKNGEEFIGVYPEYLTSEIDFYLDRIRPILRWKLTDEDEGWLWLGRWGEPLQGDSISNRVRELTRQHLGLPLSLHAFRHSVATDIALLAPMSAGITKSVLGHASPHSARYYNLASSSDAANTYQALLARIREQDRTS